MHIDHVNLKERFERIPLETIVASTTNPRTHFDPVYIADLASSIEKNGMIQPLIVRPLKKPRAGAVFEIVAGECRFRAATQAKSSPVPVIVREYSDEQALEIQLLENIDRQDLTPLEQAVGFQKLIDSNPTKFTIETIGSRKGMSPQWVLDVLSLNKLVPEAKKLLEQERITKGHAILIARQTPENQKRIIQWDDDRGDGDSGLWEQDGAGLPWDEDNPAHKHRKAGPYDELKPKSIRELESWIADHIRFDVAHAAKAEPLQFGELAATVEALQAQPGRGRKVIAITFEHFTQPEARDESERTYGPSSWKRADGTKKTTSTGWPANRLVDSPTCEHSVLGVVAAGDRRGESFEVCIARDKCQVHWKKQIAEREKNQKLRSSGKRKQAERREDAAAKREAAAREREAAADRRWHAIAIAIKKEIVPRAGKLKTVTPGMLAAALRKHRLPAKTKAKDVLVMLVTEAVGRLDFHWKHGERDVRIWAQLLGINVKAIEKAVDDAAAPKAKAS
jgi:ParB/RepB/Spo0J family partition protein